MERGLIMVVHGVIIGLAAYELRIWIKTGPTTAEK